MTLKNLGRRWMRAAMVLAVGGSAFQLSGCDPRVRGTLITGLQETTQSLSSALIDAFFLSLDDEDTSSGGSTTNNGFTTT